MNASINLPFFKKIFFTKTLFSFPNKAKKAIVLHELVHSALSHRSNSKKNEEECNKICVYLGFGAGLIQYHKIRKVKGYKELISQIEGYMKKSSSKLEKDFLKSKRIRVLSDNEFKREK